MGRTVTRWSRSGILATLACLSLVGVGCGLGGGDESEASPGADSSQVDQSTTVAEQESTGGATEAVGDQGLPADSSQESDAVVPSAPDDYLVWVHDQEPPHLHLDELATPISAWVRQGLVEGLFGVDASLGYRLELLAAEPVVAADERGRVTIEYRLRDGLGWSDGEPLTSADVAYTFGIITEGCRREADGSLIDGDHTGCVYHAQSRLGYDRIISLQVVDETRFTVTMSGFYPGWRDLFSQVMAAHGWGDTASEVNTNLGRFVGPDGPLPSSGPLSLERWDTGSQLLLAVNENYHGPATEAETAGGTDGSGQGIGGVQLVFVATPAKQIETVSSGAADLAIVGFDPVDWVEAGGGIETRAVLGSNFDHLAMNLLNPHLGIGAVRSAVVAAIDKAAVVEAAYLGLPSQVEPPPLLGNTYWMPSTPGYEDHQPVAEAGEADPSVVADLLAGVGYALDEVGRWTHPDLGPLRLRLTTAAYDPVRLAQQDSIVEQLRAAGIVVVADNVPGGGFYTDRVFAPDAIEASMSEGARGDGDLWDLAVFGWSPGPWPGGQSGTYRSRSAFNPYGLASPTFDARANECDATVDDEDRAACYNELDRFVTQLDDQGEGLVSVPLSQRLSLMVFDPTRLGELPAFADEEGAGPLVDILSVRLEP